MDKKRISIRGSKDFNREERIEIIEEYLSKDISKNDIWRKYTGYDSDHGGLLRWMLQLGYQDKPKYGAKLPLILQPFISMKKQEELENLSQKELVKRLKYSQMKEECYLLAIEIAEKELKIQILKKSNTK